MTYYLGRRPQGDLIRFQAATTPTKASHGQRFTSAIGPFRTLLGLEWYFRYGQNNPHVITTEDAERFALTDNTGGWPLIREQLMVEMGMTPDELEASYEAAALDQAEYASDFSPVSIPVLIPARILVPA